MKKWVGKDSNFAENQNRLKFLLCLWLLVRFFVFSSCNFFSRYSVSRVLSHCRKGAGKEEWHATAVSGEGKVKRPWNEGRRRREGYAETEQNKMTRKVFKELSEEKTVIRNVRSINESVCCAITLNIKDMNY